MRSNITKLYLANFLTGIVFWYGIEKLFMRSIGISSVGIAINAIVYIVVALFLDIPTGILADKWSRKYTLILGLVSLAISSIIMGASHGLWMYLLGTAIWGCYTVFTGGTYQAMTYDSLLEVGREKEYVKHQGRSYGMFLVGISLSSVVGGYMASHFSYSIAYYWTVVPSLLTIGVLVSMREPNVHKPIEDTKLLQHVKQTAKLLGRTPLLLFSSILFLGAIVLSSSQNEYSGLYFIALGFAAVGNGWANAGKWLSSALGQFASGRLSRYTKWVIPLFFGSFTLFSIWHSVFGIGLFYIAAFFDSALTTNIEGIIQNHTPSHIRATTLSVLNFASSVVLIPVSLVFGILARNDVFHSYRFVAVIGLLFAAVWYIRPKHVRQEITSSEPQV